MNHESLLSNIACQNLILLHIKQRGLDGIFDLECCFSQMCETLSQELRL